MYLCLYVLCSGVCIFVCMFFVMVYVSLFVCSLLWCMYLCLYVVQVLGVGCAYIWLCGCGVDFGPVLWWQHVSGTWYHRHQEYNRLINLDRYHQEKREECQTPNVTNGKCIRKVT